MKKILPIFGLFLLFAAEAKAFTCYDGFELKTYPDGTKYCEYLGGSTTYPGCDNIDNSDAVYSVRLGKCRKVGETVFSCYVTKYDEEGYEEENCKYCSHVFKGCLFCNLKGCKRCNDGYELKDGKCYAISCSSNCSSCLSSICTSCKSGYILQNGQCVVKPACPSNCAECDDSGVCTKCESGYVLKNGACAVKPKTQIAFCPPDKTLSDDLCCCISK